MSLALHCDRAGCDAWQLAPAEAFLTLAGGYSTTHSHFCSLDCLLHWAAENSVPTDAREIT
jgi:hypothetical protein